MTDSSDKLHRFTDYIWLTLIMAIGLAPRLFLLHSSNFGIESDEAIVGLMGKHVLEGESWPIFYYGQDYLGSLEATLAALSFHFFGVNNFALKLVPLYFSVLFVGLTYALARRYTDRFGARVAALLAAMGPSALILWSIKARGGFIELMVIGSISLILGTDILRKSRPSGISLFFLGVVLGIGWWVNNQIIFYVAALGLALLLTFLLRVGLVKTLSYLVTGVIGFFIGGAPFWYANLFQKPRFATFNTLFGDTVDNLSGPASAQDAFFETFWEQLLGFLENALPIIFGSRRFWSAEDIFPFSTYILLTLYGFAFLFVTLHWLLRPGQRNKKQAIHDGERAPYGLLVMFCVFVGVIFSASSFGWLSEAPRYVLPLYSVIFVFVGFTAAEIRASKFRSSGKVAVGFVALILSFNIASNYLGSLAKNGQPFVFRGQRVAEDHSELYRWLADENYHHVWTNYWIGYRIAFETKEQVTFTRYRGPKTVRIPRYEEISSAEYENRVYVLVPNEARVVADALSTLGYTFRMSSVGEYTVIDKLVPVSEFGAAIELKPSNIRVPHNKERAYAMIDGNLGTRWGSGRPQRPGMEIEVVFDQPTTLTGFSMDMGFWPHDRPRGLVVKGFTADGSWCTLFDTIGNGVTADLQRDWSVHLHPRQYQRVLFKQLGKHKVFDWSIAELSFYGDQ